MMHVVLLTLLSVCQVPEGIQKCKSMEMGFLKALCLPLIFKLSLNAFSAYKNLDMLVV